MFRRQPPVHSPLSPGALTRGVASGWGPWGGSPDAALEALLRDRYGADQAVLLGSGTQALTLAIRVARPGDDAPVALPGFTCYDVATAAVGAHGPILLYDIDPETLGPDWDSLESALRRGAGLVVIAPLYGLPVDWDRVTELMDRHGAAVIEDAAQGSGATWRGEPLGSLAALSVLSFGRGKGWTGGRGGALLARGTTIQEPSDRAASVREEASTAIGTVAQWALGRPSLYGLPYRVPGLQLGETVYREPEPLRPITRFAAGVLLATARDAEREAMGRRHTAHRLLKELRFPPEIRSPTPPRHGAAGYLRLPLRVTEPNTRAHVLADLEKLGVTPGYPSSLRQLPALESRLAAPAVTPGADALARQLVTVPTHSLVGHDFISALKRSLRIRAGERPPDGTCTD